MIQPKRFDIFPPLGRSIDDDAFRIFFKDVTNSLMVEFHLLLCSRLEAFTVPTQTAYGMTTTTTTV